MRGLKSKTSAIYSLPLKVAPHVGAWIEIVEQPKEKLKTVVAPHVGAWIEMPKSNYWLNPF